MSKLLAVVALLFSALAHGEDSFTFQLSATEANIVVQALGELPYRVSAQVIQTIQQQAQVQLAAKAEPPARSTPAAPDKAKPKRPDSRERGSSSGAADTPPPAFDHTEY
jgi:hypothetical protein